MMTGRSAVHAHKQRLDATFERCNNASEDPEVLSDLARYLCILVSGFIEQAVVELTMEHVRCCSAPTVQKHVESRLRRQFTNPKSQRLIDLLYTFDNAWGSDLESFLDDEYRDAVDAVVELRNRISHGRSVDVTMHRIRDYYQRVKKVVEQIADLIVSEGA